MDIYLNKYLELVHPHLDLREIDNVKEINIYIADDCDVCNKQKVLTIINYEKALKIIEYYESYLGEIRVEKLIYNKKPSEILQIFFPKLFR